MRALLATATVAAALLATPASAAPPASGPVGTCSFMRIPADPDTGYAEAYAVYAELLAFDGALPRSGTVTCSVQFGQPTHAGPAAGAVSASGTGAIVLAGTVQVDNPDFLPRYFCTRFAYDGGPTVYWVDEEHAAGGEGYWTTDPDAPCADDTHPPEAGPDPLAAADPVACAVLVALRDGLGLTDPAGPLYVGETGDTYVAGTWVWDCPPYGS